jgi:cellulose synthase/poly-beta-1,6-N-acetylglucosamine synthase-like glycosyltransferase
MSFIHTTFAVIAIISIIPILVLSIECWLALLPTKSQLGALATARPTAAVLVPAHNEATDIGNTIQALLLELTPQDRLIVIADNCIDETAKIARNLGATVLERQDLQHRGKGYALDYGLQSLASSMPIPMSMRGQSIGLQR